MPSSAQTPLSHWLISGLALIWNLAGVGAFVAHLMLTPEQLTVMPEAERALYTQAPDWLNAAFAMAVLGGSLGSLMLLMRNFLAPVLFSLSLLGVLAQNSYSLLMSNSVEVLGQQALFMAMAIILIALFLLWYSLHCKKRGLL